MGLSVSRLLSGLFGKKEMRACITDRLGFDDSLNEFFFMQVF